MKKEKNRKLVGGTFRPDTTFAKLFLALKSGPQPIKKLEKIGGPSVRHRLYGMRVRGKQAPNKFTVKVEQGKARLILGKRAA